MDDDNRSEVLLPGEVSTDGGRTWRPWSEWMRQAGPDGGPWPGGVPTLTGTATVGRLIGGCMLDPSTSSNSAIRLSDRRWEAREAAELRRRRGSSRHAPHYGMRPSFWLRLQQRRAGWMA